MKRLAHASAWLALAAVIGLALAPVGAQDDETPSIKKIMGKLNKGPKSLTQTLRKDLNADEPNWDKIKKDAKEFSQLAAKLSKNEPPAGSKESWKRLTQEYTMYARLLSDAAEKMDVAAAKAAHKKLTGACKTCHSTHKQ